MAKLPKIGSADVELKPEAGRLRKLRVRNFRSIGATPVEVDLDDIVVLVGPNNSGKSSILRAYEVVMNDGSKDGQLTTDDFPQSRPDPDVPVEIELETAISAGEPGEQWLADQSGAAWTAASGSPKIVREKWTWTQPGAGKRSGWNVQTQQWDDKVPWGAANVAKSRRPEPHPVRAFDPPEQQAKQVNELLRTLIVGAAKTIQDAEGNSVYDRLLKDLEAFQKLALESSTKDVSLIETALNKVIAAIFIDHAVEFQLPHETSEKTIPLFPTAGRLLMGPSDGHKSPLEFQGSGARRTMLWATLKLLSEQKATSGRPHVLLIDEPELCLHPSAIRDACKVLYDLASNEGWQVMITTHSPVFIDLSRDNTTIVRVEKLAGGQVQGITLYRPDRSALSADDRENLKLLNIYDPYVAEFFFGGKVIVVEGDTEYSAFKFAAREIPNLPDFHVIRARGKATIVSLAKILNHFGTRYAILHDSDKPKALRKNKATGDIQEIVNPAWTINERIREIVDGAPTPANIRLIASQRTFEEAFLGYSSNTDKPYTAIVAMAADDAPLKAVKELLLALLDHSLPLPTNAIEWNTISDLELALTT